MRKRRAVLCMSMALAAVGVVTACAYAAQDNQVARDSEDFSAIERGHYLTIVGDCAACHTGPDGKPLAGGRPIETPFGYLRSPNITPDRQTGIGQWSDDEFVSAMSKGVGRDGRHLYPGMPYTYYDKVDRKDLLAIRAYLQTIAPVRKAVDVNQLHFPFNIRASMIAWDALFFHPAPFKPKAEKSADWNRGAYLVEGLMHCGACHTPKNVLGADEASATFKGSPLQGWFAPNLTTDQAKGVGAWSDDDLITFLKTGHNRMADASGPMAEVVARSTSQMTDADLRAVTTYLRDQTPPPPSMATPLAPDDGAVKIGAAIYRDECSACHKADGHGVAGLFPALAHAPFVVSDDPTSLLHVVLRGGQSVATDAAPTSPAMPPFGWLLTDEQAAAVVTYIRNSWGNVASKVDADTVAHERADLAKRTD
ncbi:MAG TPA: cytochrome c [Magnetospirillaceae bacterium]|jgi:mono/diheme cytochrome c family protein